VSVIVKRDSRYLNRRVRERLTNNPTVACGPRLRLALAFLLTFMRGILRKAIPFLRNVISLGRNRGLAFRQLVESNVEHTNISIES